MSAQRVRIPGNIAHTRILCDRPPYTPCHSNPPSDYDATLARRRAREFGWIRVNGKDYCPEHAPESTDSEGAK